MEAGLSEWAVYTLNYADGQYPFICEHDSSLNPTDEHIPGNADVPRGDSYTVRQHDSIRFSIPSQFYRATCE